ncbi:HIRAN domain-containing protein [Cohnella suwonensis]|uniref:HIRAN domain-containing protein n=1 Tax=Cohnella suwonensis TaxID=696072 RepID=A0ABW0M2Z6_9BACL
MNLKLLVNWKASSSGKNYVVGILQNEETGYTFNYNEYMLDEAKNDGFELFIGFNDRNSIYHSEKLFSVFERRLPSINRTDFKKFLKDNNLESTEDPTWDYLCLTKGKLATDSISFVTPMTYTRSQNLLFFNCDVAGWSHTEEEYKLTKKDQELKPEIDDSNLHDTTAVCLIDSSNNNHKIGYVPRPFNQLIYRLLKKEMIFKTKVYYLDKEEGRPKIVMYTFDISEEELQKEKDLQYLVEYEN